MSSLLLSISLVVNLRMRNENGQLELICTFIAMNCFRCSRSGFMVSIKVHLITYCNSNNKDFVDWSFISSLEIIRQLQIWMDFGVDDHHDV